MIPAGAVGFIPPQHGLHGLVGRIIAWRQGVPFSHAVVALGNGTVLDSTVRWTRITDDSYWDRPGVEWYRPSRPFSEERARILRSIGYFIRDRIYYRIGSLLMFALRGIPGRRTHGMFCTYLVAEVYMTVRDEDLSGCRQPWNMDVRELLLAVRRGPFIKTGVEPPAAV